MAEIKFKTFQVIFDSIENCSEFFYRSNFKNELAFLIGQPLRSSTSTQRSFNHFNKDNDDYMLVGRIHDAQTKIKDDATPKEIIAIENKIFRWLIDEHVCRMPIASLDVVEVKINFDFNLADNGSDDLLEERRRAALQKLSPNDISALGLTDQQLYSYIKHKDIYDDEI